MTIDAMWSECAAQERWSIWKRCSLWGSGLASSPGRRLPPDNRWWGRWPLPGGHIMRYHDGEPIHVGDVVTIDVRHEGLVVACIEDGIFLHPHTKEQWTHLHDGVLIDTGLRGLIHYPDQDALEDDQV